MFDVDTLIANTDLMSLAERAGGIFKKVGFEWRSHCMLHGGHNKGAFSIYEKNGKQHWICFTKQECGQGDVVDFIRIWQNKTFKEAVEFLGGNVLADPFEMERLAKERHERAVREREAAQLKEDARRKELQAEQKHIFYHENMSDYFISEWLKRGLDESWQGFFCLGACPDFVINDGWHTPTLTTPVRNEKYEVQNISHRLLNPQEPKDKYRPERSGLGFPPFLAFPEMGMNGSVVWVIEGYIKTMVTASRTPNAEWQFIGVAGERRYKDLVEALMGKNVIVAPDPGSEGFAVPFCKAVNGRWLELPAKIDDLIVSHGYDGDWLRAMEKQARRL